MAFEVLFEPLSGHHSILLFSILAAFGANDLFLNPFRQLVASYDVVLRALVQSQSKESVLCPNNR